MLLREQLENWLKQMKLIMLAKFAEAVQADISRFRTAKEEALMAIVRRRKSLVEIRAKEKTRLKSANKSLYTGIPRQQ
jgi:hypothetical protein